ncbi:amino acid ABC transporter substrate-binding protein [Halogeometricum borinquense]|uniref:Amino acid ABC transporter substrate-binding protein n=1 Tax=Halogeometricum borinquense TaxID=60847 RepID=A0A6C0UJF4_9EURY|nr:ABC transporter substrate-binding protein [Halogeometricum borinquense]QIB75622.1 amino acid ABC transporter substrate-binding protein [Halogeometricum borinquense]
MGDSYSRRGVLRAAGSTVALGSLAGCTGVFGDQGDEPVRFGVVLPLTGSLEKVGTHGKRAVEQAVSDINQAGGILGRPVELTTIDSKASADVAVEGYKKLVDEGVVGFVGALASDTSLALAPKAAEDGIMEVSPASTNPQLSNAGRSDGRKYFGRTVPSDILQAVAMAKVLDAPQYVGAESVSLLAIDNGFGSALADEIGSSLDADVVADVRYDPSASSFDSVLDEVFAGSPDAVGFVSVPGQEKGIVDAYTASDYDAPWVFSAGMFGNDVPSSYNGFYSASLSSVRTDGYFTLSRRLSDIAPLAPYSSNAYDALFLMAAAAEMAGEASGPAIADTIRSVSGGNGHTVSVGDFGSLKLLVDAGRNLNYQGASSGVDLTANLEPLSSYLIKRVTNGNINQLELLQQQFFKSGGSQ